MSMSHWQLLITPIRRNQRLQQCRVKQQIQHNLQVSIQSQISKLKITNTVQGGNQVSKMLPNMIP